MRTVRFIDPTDGKTKTIVAHDPKEFGQAHINSGKHKQASIKRRSRK